MGAHYRRFLGHWTRTGDKYERTRAGRLVIPMTKEDRATIAQIFGSWFVRVDGQLAVGPLTQAQAQERADAMNKETMK